MPHEIATRRVLYEIAGMERITAREFSFLGADGDSLAAAIYLPIEATSPPPVAIIVEGYADPGFSAFVGCRFMDMQWTVSMAQLIAASGIAAITYANRRPLDDANLLVQHVIDHWADLGVNASRIALWATSGHGPVALSLLSRARCAVLTNAYTIDLDGATHVADAAKTFKFATSSIEEIPEGKPMFIVRSGKDEMPGLNASLDRFIARAIALDRPVTIVNYPASPHAFELFLDHPKTRRILGEGLTFLGAQLWE